MAGDMARAREHAELFEASNPEGFSNAAFVGSILRYHSRAEDREKWLIAFRRSGISGLDALGHAS